MKVKIERGLIKIQFDPQLELEDLSYRQQNILEKIGSAHTSESDPRVMSCCFSADNLRKLRKLGAKLDEDEFTRSAVTELRAKMDAFEKAAELTERIKKGEAFASDAAKNYQWKLKPFSHQVPAFHALVANPSFGLFGDTGTGKTGISVAYMDHLIKEERDWVFFIFCPRNLINNAWIPDIEKFSDLKVQSLRVDHWKRSEKLRLRQEAFATDADVYLINIEAVRGKHAKDKTKEKDLLELIKRRCKQGMKIGMLVDESSKIKSRMSANFKLLKRIEAKSERRIIISGTPSPNTLLDLWSQFDFLDSGETLQPSFTDYRHDTHRKVVLKGVSWVNHAGHEENAEKWLIRDGAAMAVHRQITKRSIRFRIEDCIDLPPQRFLRREVEMTAEQERCYEQMREYLLTELQGDLVTARVAASKVMKLREITGGFLIPDSSDGKGKPVAIDKDTPKMLELDDILEQSVADKLGDQGRPNKALVWAQYQWECRTLVDRYAKKYGARGMFGGISSGEVDRNFAAFQNDTTTRVLICHPASVGHGLTLTAANYSIFYSLSYNYDEFYQAYRRMARATQKRSMTNYLLVAPGTIDDHLMANLYAKKNLSDMVMDGQISALSILQPLLDVRQTTLDFKAEAKDELDQPQGGAQAG